MSNPLLEIFKLPPFSKIKAGHVKPAIEGIINDNNVSIENILKNVVEPSWDTLQAPLDSMDDRLNNAWSPIEHMNAVVNSEEIREVYNACLPIISDYSTSMGQNYELYNAYLKIAECDKFASYNVAKKKVIRDQLRNFKLAGVALSDKKKAIFKKLKKDLSTLTSQFSDNVLDATMAWSKLITDESMLAGLPKSALAGAKAKNYDEGWLLSLDFPCYFAIMTHCDNRELRKEMYTAYNTRASTEGPNANQYDNSEKINNILDIRHQLAELLGFGNYAEYSLETKMAESCDQVVTFLEGLASRTKSQAEVELSELRYYTKEEHKVDKLEAWDIGYFSEKLRQARYAISQEEMRPWFPVEKVINGMFEVTSRLFGVHFEKCDTIDCWHKDVLFYNICREDEVIGSFYLDLYTRENKRGGAWMGECRVRRKVANTTQLPVAYLTCNFTPPIENDLELLSHEDVVTLFHEFGHGLHHMLTRVDYAAVSGINGVPWDAVELPSQFMENWCWQKEGIALISGHFESGESLPKVKLEKLLAAKNFQSAMMMLRQLELSLFDLRLHREYKKGISVQAMLDEVRQKVAVFIPPAFNRFQNSFSHIFAGGYAAGYYSYKWAEVLSADAFSRFEEDGIFNEAAGHSFLEEILEKGGSVELMESFIRFRGREPTVDALLKQSGIL